MKTLIAFAISIVSLTLTCHAGATDDLIGTWKGRATVNVNGQIFKERVKIVFKAYEKTGLIAKTTITLPGNPKSVEVVKYHANGEVEGRVKQGTFNARETGTWKATRRTLISKIQLTGFSVNEVRKFRLVNKKKMTLTSKSSDGVFDGPKIFGYLRRK